MSHDLESLKESLRELGFRFGAPMTGTGVNWYAWRRCDGARNCTFNDVPPSLMLTPWAIDLNGNQMHSVEFSLTGDAGSDTWCNFKAYSVPIDAALDSLPRIERILAAGWNATVDAQANETSSISY